MPDQFASDATNQSEMEWIGWESPHHKRRCDTESPTQYIRPAWDMPQRHYQQQEDTQPMDVHGYGNQNPWYGQISLAAIQRTSTRRIQIKQPDCLIIQPKLMELAQSTYNHSGPNQQHIHIHVVHKMSQDAKEETHGTGEAYKETDNHAATYMQRDGGRHQQAGQKHQMAHKIRTISNGHQTTTTKQ